MCWDVVAQNTRKFNKTILTCEVAEFAAAKLKNPLGGLCHRKKKASNARYNYGST